MERTLQKAVVLGSGVMGAAIAAHLANAGLSVTMLDRKIGGQRLAQTALEQLPRQKPSPLYSKRVLERIRAGSFEEDLTAVGEADWVIEAIVEQLEAKQELLAEVEKHWKTGTIVSSNTSGISIAAMSRQTGESFRRYFMGTHFFNPPRYMKLVELIPTEETDPEAVAAVKRFCESRLGKRVVLAKDTPNFIANRIGTYGLLVTMHEMAKHGLSVSAVDALTGPVLGRPKSATFRTLDMVGLDTFVHVANNVHRQASDPEEKAAFEVPAVMKEMLQNGQIGEKAGRGFYQVVRTGGEKVIEQWDAASGSYIARDKARFPSLEAARNAKTLKEKLRVLTEAGDPGGRFVWTVMKKVLLYSAYKLPEIADDPLAVDEAMKWGFNWELGPFETWDALGVERTAKRMKDEGETLPSWIEDMLAAGRTSFYEKKEGRTFYFLPGGQAKELSRRPEFLSLRSLKERQGVVLMSNAGASLIDLGDDVACLEFHSPNNAVGPDILQMLFRSLEEVRSHYRGLVIANEGRHFCVGANLMLLLMEAQDDNWLEIDRMIRQFQEASMAIKYFEKPIVSAPFGMTLGGGVELAIPTAVVQASAETYMGLVETGVGLIPAGGGTKELLMRFTRNVDYDGKVDLQPFVNRAFETIGMAKVSTSAQEAKELGYLRTTDRISLNRDSQLYDAKRMVIALSDAGYSPPERESCRVVGEPGRAVLQMALYQMRGGGHITEHDELIGRKLAYVLTGGLRPANAVVSEQALLDLEREAFLSLCGEPKSQARMQHMLLKGKPLRN
ncbi:3-hydroxyacyl-CoA dehydrogenase/enoyl-CoA hydratase family protein [Paenibacillus sp. 32O-W]|uniref:3-hydroxyacyl-CoA dehydrogenase/enoyl-CoA hydratase family protein n=1 Tax=Paenibacillus sp. 32O-W TaxID=1695218 RepID=UPI0011A1DE0D|nr:3-hydroxyacyl-CoA dehydrogenase/enoyl-CoA hydratase family protein [Paenibacillus sp. 32O-W]